MYRQSQLIAAYPQVRGIIRAILDLQEVRLALIFGSYAKGTAHERSDIDLFIETENRTLKKSLEDQFSALSIKIGLFTTEHPLIREIVNDHIIVKGVEEYLEKTKLFA